MKFNVNMGKSLPQTQSNLASNKTTQESVKDSVRNAPRGQFKSGRKWKSVRTNRYSMIRKDKAAHSSWEAKMKQKQDRQNVRLYEQELKDAMKREKEEKRVRREENEKRRLENERKSEVVQTIKNTAKIKRMKKKQLRQIAKR